MGEAAQVTGAASAIRDGAKKCDRSVRGRLRRTRSGSRARAGPQSSNTPTPSVRVVNLSVGAALGTMTDAEVLDLFKRVARSSGRARGGPRPDLDGDSRLGVRRSSTGERSDQWVPRGEVLRCHIEDEDERPVILVDDAKLDLEGLRAGCF